jgi:hypothetical protein
MATIYVIYDATESEILGCYSTLELAIVEGKKHYDNRHDWCILEKILDNPEPRRYYADKVYENIEGEIVRF